MTVNQDGVGERSESGVKAGKRKLYSVQFSRRGRLRRVQLWEPERADDKSHLLFCYADKKTTCYASGMYGLKCQVLKKEHRSVK